MTLKDQVRLLDKMGVSHYAMEEASGLGRRTIEMWMNKEDAKLRP